MGTNFYYIEKPPCTCCGREYSEVHIGKRSSGWRFTIKVGHPSETWNDIKTRLESAFEIRDEYGTKYTSEEMIEIIKQWQTGRSMAEEYSHRGYWIDPASGYVLTINEFT